MKEVEAQRWLRYTFLVPHYFFHVCVFTIESLRFLHHGSRSGFGYHFRRRVGLPKNISSAKLYSFPFFLFSYMIFSIFYFSDDSC